MSLSEEAFVVLIGVGPFSAWRLIRSKLAEYGGLLMRVSTRCIAGGTILSKVSELAIQSCHVAWASQRSKINHQRPDDFGGWSPPCLGRLPSATGHYCAFVIVSVERSSLKSVVRCQKPQVERSMVCKLSFQAANPQQQSFRQGLCRL